MKPADFTRVFDILSYQQEKYPQPEALNYALNNKWINYPIEQLQVQVNAVSSWLLKNDFKKGDTIAIVPATGNPLWMIIDFACQQIGMITVPLHPTASAGEIEFILAEVQAKICITSNIEQLEKVKPLFTSKHLYHLRDSENEFFPPLHANFPAIDIDEVTSITQSISPADVVCILYTSGTTGTPKGAVLTHHNIVSNIKSILPLFPIKAGDRVLSFLPFSHVFERTTCYAYLAFGASVHFCESVDTVAENFKIVKPVFFTSVPKTLERMYAYLGHQCEQKNKIKRWLVRWAMKVGEDYQDDSRKSIAYSLKLFLARILVLNRWRNALSSKTKYIVVGAAALRPEIARLFSAARVATLSGYGMTEAAPFIAVNRPEPGMNKFGTVGLPIPGVKIKLDDINDNGEGEILVQGPNVMQGYFNRPELNAEVFTTDGWFRTGDLGKLMNKRFLTITGRKKDLFKTTAGIYIAPQELENHLLTSPFILQNMIYGFNKPFVMVLLVPDFSMLKNWCDENSIHYTSPQFMIHNIKVIQKIQIEIDGLNQTLASYKKIKKFILCDSEWTTENGDLTTSLKIMRNRVYEKFKSEIEKAYG